MKWFPVPSVPKVINALHMGQLGILVDDRLVRRLHSRPHVQMIRGQSRHQTWSWSSESNTRRRGTRSLHCHCARPATQLRGEHSVFPVKLPDGQTAWLITRYDDALSALKDRRFSKDKLNAGQKQPWIPAFFKPLARNMLDLEDPDHARLRGLVHKAFAPKIVENIFSFASSRQCSSLGRRVL
jgi:cytochrome P450